MSKLHQAQFGSAGVGDRPKYETTEEEKYMALITLYMLGVPVKHSDRVTLPPWLVMLGVPAWRIYKRQTVDQWLLEASSVEMKVFLSVAPQLIKSTLPAEATEKYFEKIKESRKTMWRKINERKKSADTPVAEAPPVPDSDIPF